MIFKHKGLYIKKSPIHGWGVFINEEVKEGELLEEAPIVRQYDSGNKARILHPYLMPYSLDENDPRWFIPTGYSILLNHSNNENVKWDVNKNDDISRFYAKRNIKANEELFINYNLWKIQ